MQRKQTGKLLALLGGTCVLFAVILGFFFDDLALYHIVRAFPTTENQLWILPFDVVKIDGAIGMVPRHLGAPVQVYTHPYVTMAYAFITVGGVVLVIGGLSGKHQAMMAGSFIVFGGVLQFALMGLDEIFMTIGYDYTSASKWFAFDVDLGNGYVLTQALWTGSYVVLAGFVLGGAGYCLAYPPKHKKGATETDAAWEE